MNYLHYRIHLDMFEAVSQKTIKAKKGDTACSIIITLTEHGKIYNIPDDCNATFTARKPDGTILYNAETCRIEDNAIVYDFTKQTTACEGNVECEVVLYKGDMRLTSPLFTLFVGESVYNVEDVLSAPEADALVKLLIETNEELDKVYFKKTDGMSLEYIEGVTRSEESEVYELSKDLRIPRYEDKIEELENSKVVVDSALNINSNNPVENKVITPAINMMQQQINANKVTVDSEMSIMSTNPVQNRIVTAELTSVKNNLSSLTQDVSRVNTSVDGVAGRVTEAEKAIEDIRALIGQDPAPQVQLVDGEFIGLNDGLFKPDGTCSRTEYIPCAGKDVIKIDFNGLGTSSGTRAWWYDADKNPLSKMTIYVAQMTTVGWSEIPVIDGAAYYAVCDYTEKINQFIFETSESEDAVVEYVTSVNGITPDENGNVNIEVPVTPSTEASASETDRECYALRKSLPEYYTAYPTTADTIDADCYIDGKVNSVPEGDRFLFVTDMHWVDNVNNSFPLMLYAYKKLGLNTVVHGGDVVEAYNNDKNKGALELRKWANEMRACFGDKMLPVFGNHDANWAGLSFSKATETDISETVIPYSVVESIFLKGYKQNIVQETDDEINQRYAAWMDDITDDTDKAEFVAWCKLHFYYDDVQNKTRHIVLNNVGFSPIFKKYFRALDIELRLQYEWLYDVLLDTPDDFNVVVTAHFLVQYQTNSITLAPALNIMKLLSLAKTNGSAWVTYANGWADNAMTYASNTFSFEGRNRTGKIICLCGHAHWDYACVCHTAADGTYKSEDYTDDLTIGDDGILCIMTQTDAIRSANYDMSKYPATSVQATMTEGTVTEQCFDVVTIADDAVTCTRFGAGEDRIFKY